LRLGHVDEEDPKAFQSVDEVGDKVPRPTGRGRRQGPGSNPSKKKYLVKQK
jgi:hypothetical protein